MLNLNDKIMLHFTSLMLLILIINLAFIVTMIITAKSSLSKDSKVVVYITTILMPLVGLLVFFLLRRNVKVGS